MEEVIVDARPGTPQAEIDAARRSSLVRAGRCPPEWLQPGLKRRRDRVERKYREDQARDDHGRFASEGGDGGGGSEATIAAPQFSDLPPKLQEKMAAKLEAMTGLPIESLSAEVRDNLGAIAAAEWKVNPKAADWYHQYHEAALAKVETLNGTKAAGVPAMTEPKYEAMMSVTSALNDPKDNLVLVDAWASTLLHDPVVNVSAEDLADYNHFADTRTRQGTFLESDLEPGDYHLSELPSYMVPSMAREIDPPLPYAMNTENLVKVTDIFRDTPIGEVISGPKQSSFYNNLVAPDDERFATIDKWMYRAAIGDTPITKTTDAHGTITQSMREWETDTRFGTKVTLSTGAQTRAGASPQDFFQSGPASKADNWPSGYGVYPFFSEQVARAADDFNSSHGTSLNASEFQALVWAGVQRGQAA